MLKGWEVSTDRIDKYEKMMSKNPIGDPIITSKCKLDKENGLLVVSYNGFAWRIKVGPFTNAWDSKKSKWLRWHDVINVIPKKAGEIQVEITQRKNGSLNLDKKGSPKTKRWKFKIQANKGEQKAHWQQRQQSFNNIMLDIFNRNRGEGAPETSDSRT